MAMLSGFFGGLALILFQMRKPLPPLAPPAAAGGLKPEEPAATD